MEIIKLQKHKAIALLGMVFLLHAWAWGQRDPQGLSSNYQIPAIYPPELVRPAVKYSPEQLKFRQVGGDLPTTDGEQFHITILDKGLRNQEEANDLLKNFLGSLQSPLSLERHYAVKEVVATPKADEAFINQEIRGASETTKKRLSSRPSGASSDELISELSEDVKRVASATKYIYRFVQQFEQVPIDNTALVAHTLDDDELVSLQGRFFNEVKPSNNQVISLVQAQREAVEMLMRKFKLRNLEPAKQGEMVLLPYGDGFRYAWKTQLTADGPYNVWIDAENAEVLQLIPDFFFGDNAKGLVFNPDPNVGTKEMRFEVDPAKEGKYTLNLKDILTLTNNGADGGTGIVTVNDDGSGTANFNVSPINGTSVQRTSDGSYNSQFQQVNIYAHLFNERKYYLLLGSQAFSQINASFNNPGGNASCCPPTFNIGTATNSSSTSCNDVYNSGIDATVIAHEFGHWLNGIQYQVSGGSLHGAINEGLADFWGCTWFNTPTFGNYWGLNCAAPDQGGWTPRQAEATDIFPDRNSSGGSNEIHSAGQLTNWANWSARQGMNELIDFGKLMIELTTIKAMTTAGVSLTVDGTDKSLHDAHIDLLKQQATILKNSRLLNKLLAGYARAGFFLAASDAVIDINDSYLDRASTTGPTFTIWTGRDYAFSGNNVNTGSQPFNSSFMVEVANDENFTTNLVSSGWLSGVTAGAGGSATWTLPATDWTTLKAANQLFYRVSTRNALSANLRQSWKPGNGFLTNTKVGKAAINGTGSKDCACSAGSNSSAGMVMLPVLPIFGLVVYRFRVRRRKS